MGFLFSKVKIWLGSYRGNRIHSRCVTLSPHSFPKVPTHPHFSLVIHVPSFRGAFSSPLASSSLFETARFRPFIHVLRSISRALSSKTFWSLITLLLRTKNFLSFGNYKKNSRLTLQCVGECICNVRTFKSFIVYFLFCIVVLRLLRHMWYKLRSRADRHDTFHMHFLINGTIQHISWIYVFTINV